MTTLLTPEIHDLIVRLVRGGNHIDTAASIAGVSETTVRTWLRVGRVEGREPYATFWQEVKKAEAEKEQEWTQQVERAAASGEWQASMQLLKNRFPQRWQEKVRVEVQAQMDDIFRKLQAGLDEATFNRVVDVISDNVQPTLRSATDGPAVDSPTDRPLLPSATPSE